MDVDNSCSKFCHDVLPHQRGQCESACKTCSGTKKVTVGAKTFPCPATGCGVPPCETCKGAGKVTIGETEYPCPEAKCTAKGVGR